MSELMSMLAPYIYVLGWSLLHFLWQGALIGLLYALLRGQCTNSSARHRLGMACLTLMLACPLSTLALLWPSAGDAAAFTAAASASSLASVAASIEVRPTASLEALLPWCVGIWLAGVCVIALRSLMHWRRLSRIVGTATPLSREWQLRLIELSQRFGIVRPVRLLSSFEVTVPTLIGWLKPAILLPASLFSGFTPTQIELILAHELAHVRRYDYIANLIQVVVETLLFYHPMVHWICSDVRQQREQCCDDLVLSVGGGDRLAYARTLADLEEWIQEGAGRDFGTAMPALGVGGGVLLTRVQRIVEAPDMQRGPQTRGGGFTLPALVACVGLLLAMLRLNSTVHDALARASAASAELLAAATFHISADNPTFPLQLKSTITLPPVPQTAERGVAPAPRAPQAAPVPEAKVSDGIAVPNAAESPARHEIPASLPVPVPKQETEAQAIAAPPAPLAAPVEKPAAPAAVVQVGPRPLRVVSPTYPTGALRDGVTGKVDMDFRIGADGSVQDIRVLAARPAGVFDQAAIAALRQWRFAAPSTPDAARYNRSFAFTRGAAPSEPCREVTGSHICRGAETDNKTN